MFIPGIVERDSEQHRNHRRDVGRDAGKQVVAEKIDEQQHRHRACGVEPLQWVATVSANHFTNPTRMSPSASATRSRTKPECSKRRIFAVMSSQVTTLVSSIRQITMSAAVVAFTVVAAERSTSPERAPQALQA